MNRFSKICKKGYWIVGLMIVSCYCMLVIYDVGLEESISFNMEDMLESNWEIAGELIIGELNLNIVGKYSDIYFDITLYPNELEVVGVSISGYVTENNVVIQSPDFLVGEYGFDDIGQLADSFLQSSDLNHELAINPVKGFLETEKKTKLMFGDDLEPYWRRIYYYKKALNDNQLSSFEELIKDESSCLSVEVDRNRNTIQRVALFTSGDVYHVDIQLVHLD